MESLPQELLDRVAQFLDGEDLKHLPVVSRKFQHAVERASGRFACFTFKDHSLEERRNFTSVFSSHRLRYLRRIEMYTIYAALEPRKRARSCRQRRKGRNPSPQPEPIQCRELEEELKQKNETFTDQIARCFEVIKAVEDSGSGEMRLQLVVFTPTRQVHECYCNHRRYSSWRVHLLSPEILPELRSVYGLSVCNPETEYDDHQTAQSRIDLRVLIDLAGRCPNLEYLGCKLGEDEWTNRADPALDHFKHNHVGPLRDTRSDFGQALRDIKLPSLQHVQLDFISDICGAVSEQRRPLPDLIQSRSYDIFSSSLSLLSLNLLKMELQVMADKTLFWPHNDKMGSAWPNLESLNVMFHIGSPSGSWYFKAPPGAENSISTQDEPVYPPLEDSDRDGWHDASRHPDQVVPTFRIVPVDEMIGPFLESFAKSAASMPKLKEAILWAPLSFNTDIATSRYDSDDSDDSDSDDDEIDRTAFALYPDNSLAWGIAYVAPKQPAFDGGDSNSPSRQLWWRVGHWRPGEELRQLFQKIGQAQWNSQLIEHWTDSQYGNGLVAREWFSEESIFAFKNGPLGAYV